MLLACLETVLYFWGEYFYSSRLALYLIDRIHHNLGCGCINGRIEKVLCHLRIAGLRHMTAVQTWSRCKFGSKFDSGLGMPKWNSTGIAQILGDIAEGRFASGHAKDLDTFCIRIISIRRESGHEGLKRCNLATQLFDVSY